MQDPLIVKQLAAGRDFATGDPVARSMQNFVYLLGDSVARECLVVDPAWDVQGIVDAATADGYTIVGALVTHWHPDHVGGSLMGHDVQGLSALLEIVQCPIYVNEGDATFVKMMTGLGDSELSLVRSGDRVKAGSVEVECLHTPGHTAGSQCFRCGGALVSGDTLFLDGCGRTDLPGGDVEVMWDTLSKLLELPRDLVLYPGHDYGSQPHAPMEEVARTNAMLKAPDYDTFLAMRGGR
ncbi:MAG: MBL fold metallo-hydrolase [Myxococcales bacterium]|nr:MBL fold metallo-hydrolase [Myxococcales bacterium]